MTPTHLNLPLWENDQTDLSCAASDLERAAFLVKHCRDYLRTVEQKVEEIAYSG
ncbi:MAG: exodeoxyribonuclease VII small subunit [Bacteroidales bacterium]|nr:exodeoxyribonuclease VII small subunit [Bacteroidales bacterium]